MDILGTMGQMYMFFLLALLILGAGFAAWAFIENISKKTEKLGANKAAVQKKEVSSKEENKRFGGINMSNNGWLKLAIFSFVGVLISVALMGFLNTSGTANNYNNMQMVNGQMNSNMQMNNSGNQYSQEQLQTMQNQLNQMQQQLNNYQNGNMTNSQSQGNMNNMQQNSNMQQNNNSNSNSNNSSSGGGMNMM